MPKQVMKQATGEVSERRSSSCHVTVLRVGNSSLQLQSSLRTRGRACHTRTWGQEVELVTRELGEGLPGGAQGQGARKSTHLSPPKMSEDPTDLTPGSPSGQLALIMATAF